MGDIDSFYTLICRLNGKLMYFALEQPESQGFNIRNVPNRTIHKFGGHELNNGIEWIECTEKCTKI